MSSPLSVKQWLIIILVNVIVSAVTTSIVVRVLIDQPAVKVINADAAGGQQATAPASVTPLPQPSATALPAGNVETPAPTAAPTDAITATLPNTPTQPAAAQSGVNVRISAVLYPGQRQREVVVIVNEGAETSLQGWTLASSRGIIYTFGNVTLFRDTFISLHTTSGADVPTDLFWKRADPAWQSGDSLTLANQGQAMATFKVK